MKRLRLKKSVSEKGQATAELAIMGTVVLMLLSYLVSQGFIYNNRQALEMYTFREALKLSKAQERGINLTVIRDVITPSFFTGLSRQRLMATSIVEYNPWKIWTAIKEDPEDVATRQLIQVNDAMIQKGYFVEVPPTLVDVKRSDGGDKQVPLWTTSAISEIDPQSQQVRKTSRITQYSSRVTREERPRNYDYRQGVNFFQPGDKTVTRQLSSKDSLPLVITFEKADRIKQNYFKDNWDGKIQQVDVLPINNMPSSIPQDIIFYLDETIRKEKTVVTANPEP